MVKAAFLVLSLLAVGLAGCIEPPAPVGAAGVPVETVGTMGDWYTVEASAGPDANLTAFWWTVPEGAVYPSAIFDRSDTTALEFALVVPETSEIQEWALLALGEDEGMLWLAGMALDTASEMTDGTTTNRVEVASPAPFVLTLGYDRFEEGDRVGFVLAVRSPEVAPITLGFRVLPSDPGWDDVASATTTRFLGLRGNSAPVVLPVAGVGVGLQNAMHLELNYVFIGLGHVMMTTDAVQREGGVSPDTRPAASRRVETLAAAFDRPGFSRANAIHYASHAAGTWDGRLDLHGQTLAHQGYVASGPGVLSVVTGIPYFYGVGEGVGAASSEFSLDVVAVTAGGLEIILFQQFDLGATMTDLLGKPAHGGAARWAGIVPTVDAMPSGDLRVTGGDGVAMTLIGAAPKP